MRTLLDWSRPVRIAVALAGLGAAPLLAGAAFATGDVAPRPDALRFDASWFALRPAIVPGDAVTPDRPVRRIGAAARPPLRVTLARPSPGSRFAEPPVVFAKRVVAPAPSRPAPVSLLEDRTLRIGDAVMMADGIRVFHAAGVWPYRPRDFTRLSAVPALDGRLRATLDGLDRNPPALLSSAGTSAG